MNNPNVNQRGDVSIASGRQVIVPRVRLNCNGRITNVAVSMVLGRLSGTNLPLFQVWHPTPNSTTYNKVGEVELPLGDLFGIIGAGYYVANLLLNSNNQIEFQSGDVIGYYQPSDPQRLLSSVQTGGYISYSNTVTNPLTSIDINNVNIIENNRQPLIEITYGKII